MDLKQLKDLLKILRAQGVLEFSNGNLQIKLSEEVPSNKSRIKEEILEEPELSEEELIYYSATTPVEQA